MPYNRTELSGRCEDVLDGRRHKKCLRNEKYENKENLPPVNVVKRNYYDILIIVNK